MSFLSFVRWANLDGLLVALSLGIVARLLSLVANGILSSGGTEDLLVAMISKEMGRRKSYRVPMEALLSLATSLLPSLETPEAAFWTCSET